MKVNATNRANDMVRERPNCPMGTLMKEPILKARDTVSACTDSRMGQGTRGTMRTTKNTGRA